MHPSVAAVEAVVTLHTCKLQSLKQLACRKWYCVSVKSWKLFKMVAWKLVVA